MGEVEMENILLWIAILGITAVISDVLVKGIESLYIIHSDLLINEAWLGKIPRRRFFMVYCMIVFSGILLIGKNFTPPLLTVNMLFSLLLIVIIVTDYEQHLIFDRILAGIAALAILSFGLSDLSITDRIIGALAGGIGMFVLAMLMGGTLGFGDVKLVFVLGLWQGIDHLMIILFTGFIGGGIAAFLFLVTGVKKRKDFFAYGPYFVFGAFFNMLAGG